MKKTVIDEQVAERRKKKWVTIQHSSLLVFATPKQQAADAYKVFATGADILTGTEAGPAAPALRRALRREARRAGYYIHLARKTDGWVAVRKDLVSDGTHPRKGHVPVFASAKTAGDPNGPYSAKGITYMSFFCKGLDHAVTVGASHFLTKGKRRDQTPAGRWNHYDMNVQYAEVVGKWAKDFGVKDNIVFFGADTNIPDRTMDVFRGKPLTTCWDDIGKYVDTGHGSIDVIARYDRDEQVKCVSARELQLHLASDHDAVEATYTIEKI